jgi:hypothetical protein
MTGSEGKAMSDYKYNVKIDASGYGQPTAESCWWASYAIIHIWNKMPVGSIRDKIKKAGLDYDDYYANGLPPDDFPKTRAALGLVGWRGAYASTLVDDFEALGLLIKGYGPLWCAFAKPSAHVVVVTGVDSDANTIHIVNPWGGNGIDADSQYLTPPTFRHRLNTTAYSVFQAFM